MSGAISVSMNLGKWLGEDVFEPSPSAIKEFVVDTLLRLEALLLFEGTSRFLREGIYVHWYDKRTNARASMYINFSEAEGESVDKAVVSLSVRVGARLIFLDNEVGLDEVVEKGIAPYFSRMLVRSFIKSLNGTVKSAFGKYSNMGSIVKFDYDYYLGAYFGVILK